jgi:hypothetical protein
MLGLVPDIPTMMQYITKRDRRDKPGDDSGKSMLIGETS